MSSTRFDQCPFKGRHKATTCWLKGTRQLSKLERTFSKQDPTLENQYDVDSAETRTSLLVDTLLRNKISALRSHRSVEIASK